MGDDVSRELPFRIWHNLARAFYQGRRGAEIIQRTSAENPEAVVHVVRDESGQLGNTICLWSSEAHALTCDLRAPSYVLIGRPLKKREFTPVFLLDVLADMVLLERLRDRLGSLVLYDPEALPDFPDWTWTFSGGSGCNLLIENGHLIPPPDWQAEDGRFKELGAGAGCIRIIDGEGQMGLIADSGDVKIPCSLAYISRPPHGDHLACEAAADKMPEPSGPCDLIDIKGKRLNPPGLKVRAGTLRHDIAVVHPDSAHGKGLTGFMTSTGEPFGGSWKDIRAFSEDFAAVQDPETALWGYIDKQGTLVVHPRFSRAESFDRSHAVVATPESEGLLGLIDWNGTLVVEPAWRELKWLLGKYFLATDRESALGLIDNRGNVIIEPYYPSREEDAEISKAHGSIRAHPFVRKLGEMLREKAQREIGPDGSLALFTGLLSSIGAGDIELLAAGLWGRSVTLIADYQTGAIGTLVKAGNTGKIGWHFPVTASIFDLSKEAPVRGLPLLPYASIGVPWELLRFSERGR